MTTTSVRPASPLSKFELDMLNYESALPPSLMSSEKGASDVHTMTDTVFDDVLPVLVASSSSLSSSNSCRDSWEQADAVVETILIQRSSAPSPTPTPLSWMCGAAPLSSYLPALESCQADTSCSNCTADRSSSTQQQVGLDFQQAFHQGQVLPYMVQRFGGNFHKQDQRYQYKWNGHLPLDPVPNFFYRYPVLRERRKHRIPCVEPEHHALFAPSLSMEDDALSLSSSSSSSSSSVRHRLAVV